MGNDLLARQMHGVQAGLLQVMVQHAGFTRLNDVDGTGHWIGRHRCAASHGLKHNEAEGFINLQR